MDDPSLPIDETAFAYLPNIFRDINRGIGYSNAALQFAVLAINASPRIGDEIPSEEGAKCLSFYTLALQAMAKSLPCPPQIAQVIVLLATLTIFLRLETKLGTLRGGLIHCKQADLLIIKHINQLILLPIGCRLLCVLVSIKSWYSLQSSPWDHQAYLLPEVARTPLLRVLRACPDQGHLVLALLCESKNIYTRILLGRLFGPSTSHPSFRSWSRQYETIRGIALPQGGVYAHETEECYLAKLAKLQRELDAWHDRLTTHDSPIYGKTVWSSESLKARPSILRHQPLRFRSYGAAMNYMHYAAAQALCSRRILDTVTGEDLTTEPKLDPWIQIILQVMSGLDPAPSTEYDFMNVGLMWVIYVVLFCSLHQDVLYAFDSEFPWLQAVSAAPGSTAPLWMIRRLVQNIREERALGRIVLCTAANLGNAEEWSNIWSAQVQYRLMVMGRVIETGAGFYDVLQVF